ncbi:MAG TPA: major capsid protein [Emticicia sp.]
MIKSLIQGLSEKDVEAMLNEYTLTEFYFPTLFPLKYVTSLKWESLEGSAGAPVAADVVSWDSRAPRKRREVLGKASGDIPKIAVGRDKTESQMNEYNALRRLTTGSAQRALLDWIWEDQEFCFKAVNARLEWLALRIASTGKVSLTKDTNDGVVTEFAVDFKIPTANKSGYGSDAAITVANKATSKPISKIRAVVKAAKAKGKKLNYIFTDQDMADAILASDETVAFVAPWVMQATNLTTSPSLLSLNTALRNQGLPQIGVVESYVNIEIKGERTQVNPWEAGVMLFSETNVLGNTQHSNLADEDVDSTISIKQKREHVLIKRFAQEEPLTESVIALANAFPVMNNTDAKWLVDGLNANWSK